MGKRLKLRELWVGLQQSGTIQAAVRSEATAPRSEATVSVMQNGRSLVPNLAACLALYITYANDHMVVVLYGRGWLYYV